MTSTHTSAAVSSINDTNHSMPSKTRDIHNHHMDSTVWDDLKFRPDDIIISTFPKAGTTWTQQITCQLLHAGDEKVAPNALSPWVELRVIPRADMLQMLEAQTSRRFMKTHLPIDAIVFNPEAKYIFCGRDGRDSMWSWHNHLSAATDMFYQLFNDAPGRVGPALRRPSGDPRDMFRELLRDEMDPALGWQFWSHIRGWWEVRSLPNVLMIHYSDLKADLDGEMRRIAKFLEIPEMSPDQWKAAVEHCTFDWMKAHADLAAPQQAETVWKEGASSFIHKGKNGRWKDILSEEENRRYLERARQELGQECAQWLENGRLRGGVKLD